MRSKIWLIGVAAGAVGWAAAEHTAAATDVNRALPVGLVIVSFLAAALGPALWSLSRVVWILWGIGGTRKGRWRLFVRLGAAIFLTAVGSGLVGLAVPPGPGTLGILGAIDGATTSCSALVLASWLEAVTDEKREVLGAGDVASGLARGLVAACYWPSLVLWAWGLYSYVLPAVAHWLGSAELQHDGNGYKGPLVAAVCAVAMGLFGVWPWIGANLALAHLNHLAEPGRSGIRPGRIMVVGYVASVAFGIISILLYCAGAEVTGQIWFLGLAVLPAYLTAGCAGLVSLALGSTVNVTRTPSGGSFLVR